MVHGNQGLERAESILMIFSQKEPFTDNCQIEKGDPLQTSKTHNFTKYCFKMHLIIGQLSLHAHMQKNCMCFSFENIKCKGKVQMFCTAKYETK